jgi:FkbM family methyltransferase
MSEFNLYKEYISPNSICYDIGAHIGEISVQMKSSGAEVYAFEPSPNNFPILKSNCEHLGIKCYDVALHESSYECFTRFKDCKTDYKEDGVTLDTVQYIKYVNLENFIKENNIPLPNFVKLDVEGMESIVLKTFEFLFNSVRPIIYAEIHAAPRGNSIQNYPDNPHWKWPEEGGFDFNNLKKFNYSILDPAKNIFNDLNSDYNPPEKTHQGFLLIPN